MKRSSDVLTYPWRRTDRTQKPRTRAVRVVRFSRSSIVPMISLDIAEQKSPYVLCGRLELSKVRSFDVFGAFVSETFEGVPLQPDIEHQPLELLWKFYEHIHRSMDVELSLSQFSYLDLRFDESKTRPYASMVVRVRVAKGYGSPILRTRPQLLRCAFYVCALDERLVDERKERNSLMLLVFAPVVDVERRWVQFGER